MSDELMENSMSDNPMLYKSTPWVIKPLVPDEIYVDREEFLDYFYKDAHRAVERSGMSTVLLGWST